MAPGTTTQGQASANGQTRRVRYIVRCGNDKTRPIRSFAYFADVPVSFTTPGPANSGPTVQEESIFIIQVIRHHEVDILKAEPWQCAICSKPASRIAHDWRTPKDIKPELLADPVFVPFILDYATPVCSLSSSCNLEIARRWNELEEIEEAAKTEATPAATTQGSEKSLVKVSVTCGDLSSAGTNASREFEFFHPGPAPFRRLEESNSLAHVGHDDYHFLIELVDCYRPEIMAAQEWKCIVCKKVATSLHHNFGAYLDEPRVSGIAMPICQEGSVCELESIRQLNQIMASNNMPFGGGCDNCGKILGVRLCSGCKISW